MQSHNTEKIDTIWSISEISVSIKCLLEKNFNNIYIKAEVSALKLHSSGHAYFVLKDDKNSIDAVCWKGTKGILDLKDGLEILCLCRISTYGSKYQLIVISYEMYGIGQLLQTIEERKRKLMLEGLFDSSRKRTLPKVPKKIAIITSPTGAVIQDILHRIKERFPLHVLIYSALMQGENCTKQICKAIEYLNNMAEPAEIIIIARGGGSLQDLMPFNDEEMARAVYKSNIPIVSAVGHETDTTIIDYVADLRAPTPTAAAELITPVLKNLQDAVKEKNNILLRQIDNIFNIKMIALKLRQMPDWFKVFGIFIQKIDKLNMPDINNIVMQYQDKINKIHISEIKIKEKLDNMAILKIRHENYFIQTYQKLSNKFDIISNRLEDISYQKTLQRGFVVINNGLTTSVNQLERGEEFIVRFSDGQRHAIVK